MLHLYAFSNFQSFLDRTEVSLRLSGKAAVRGWQADSRSGQRLSLALAALGPNGAGKTALLKPLAFLGWFIAGSFSARPDDPIPLAPHFAAPNEPSMFEIEAEDADGVLWRYVLRATPQRVLFEALYRKRERFSYVFVREWDASQNTYSIKQQDFGLASAEAQKVRQNASLISTAAQYGVERATHVSGFNLSTNITAAGREPMDPQRLLRAAEFFAKRAGLQPQMKRLLSSWDLGLTEVNIEEITVPESPQQSAQTWWVPMGVHQLQNGDKHAIPMMMESRGTQSAFVLLSLLLPTLEAGGVALVDEFENDLHPLMLEPILDLFANPKTNPHKAQIVFTCHSAEVLNLLHKAQIMLVEKTDCKSQAWRLDTMQGVRSDDNFYSKYMSGAYGAVPVI